MAKPVKTNAMRMFERAGIPYTPIYYNLGDEEFSGQAVSRITGIDEAQSFKTLCAKGDKRGPVVFVVPVSAELQLKAAAAAAGEKRVYMVKVSEILALTGYVRGCVSPIGMKRPYPIFFDQSALLFETIAVSAGAKGATMLVQPNELISYLGAQTAALINA